MHVPWWKYGDQPTAPDVVPIPSACRQTHVRPAFDQQKRRFYNDQNERNGNEMGQWFKFGRIFERESLPKREMQSWSGQTIVGNERRAFTLSNARPETKRDEQGTQRRWPVGRGVQTQDRKEKKGDWQPSKKSTPDHANQSFHDRLAGLVLFSFNVIQCHTINMLKIPALYQWYFTLSWAERLKILFPASLRGSQPRLHIFGWANCQLCVVGGRLVHQLDMKMHSESWMFKNRKPIGLPNWQTLVNPRHGVLADYPKIGPQTPRFRTMKGASKGLRGSFSSAT